MKLTADMLVKMTGSGRNLKRKQGYADFVNKYMATRSDLAKPHKQALCISQLLPESGYFRYTSEIWGPTRAQRRYEGRKDLGNIEAGDGSKFRGHGGIQTTGRANHRAVTLWIRENIDPNAPDFEENPELLASEEWFGATVMWYFDDCIPVAYLDDGDVHMVSAYVNNGGHRNRRINHLGERFEAYTWAALVYLGYGRDDVKAFQADQGLIADGIAGPQTLSAMHDGLVIMSLADDMRKPKAQSGGWLLNLLKGFKNA
jgi:putative chitinase